jgi:IPT/TIG domain-containing protein
VRFQKKKVSARIAASALALGVVGMLVTALPALAVTPTVTAVNPTTGVRGTLVSVTGTDFQNPAVTSVTIGGVAATFTVTGPSTLTATVPCGVATATNLAVLVTNGTGTSTDTAADDFDVTASLAPTITSFTPTGGPAGTIVTITGTNLCNPSAVTFNNIPAVTFSATNATTIVATVPATATTGLIRVTTPTAPTAASATNFTVGAAPTITSFTPTSGPVGTNVTITGTNLTGVTSVKFNGLAATFTTSTATSVTATVPTGATTGKVSVTTGVGTATSTADFTVTTAPVARTVSGFQFQPHSRVAGQVNVSSGLTACRSMVRVVIQKQTNGGWKWTDTTATTASGSFKTYIPPSNGRFRAKVNQFTLVNGVVCGGATSNTIHS